MLKKIIIKSIKLNECISNDIKLRIDTRCYTKSKYLDECVISSDISLCHIIKVTEYPYVLIVTPSLEVYPTRWKTIKGVKSAFKNCEIVQKRFQISDDKQSYVFTDSKTNIYELKIPIIYGEGIEYLSGLKKNNSGFVPIQKSYVNSCGIKSPSTVYNHLILSHP